MNKYRNTNAANTTKTYNKHEIENPTKNISISFFSMRVFFHQNDAAYHIPLIISPYGMSCWISR